MKTISVTQTGLGYLYWESGMTPTEVAKRIDFTGSAQALAKEAGDGIIVGFQCYVCDGPIKVSSNSAATSFLNDHNRKQRYSKGKDSASECRTCIDKRLKESREQHARQREAHAARKHELMHMPYRDYLQTEEWQGTRKDALRRAKFCCQTCSAKGTLHVHHRTYVRRGAELNSDLIVLCADCHLLFHENGRLAEGGRAS